MSEQDDLIGELRATGRALVRRNNVQAKEIAQLRADLAAERQRREAAEKDANELRADNEMNARYAARALHAEAALAAVPWSALWRLYNDFPYENSEFAATFNEVWRWLYEQQPEVQP